MQKMVVEQASMRREERTRRSDDGRNSTVQRQLDSSDLGDIDGLHTPLYAFEALLVSGAYSRLRFDTFRKHTACTMLAGIRIITIFITISTTQHVQNLAQPRSPGFIWCELPLEVSNA